MSQEEKDFIEQRNRYSDARQASQATYDRTIASVSGGAFGLSLLAVNLILSHGDIILCRGCIVFAWWSFGVSIGSVVISHFLSEKAHGEAIEQLDGQYSASPNEEKNTPENAVDKLSKMIENFNILSGASFIVGMILFLIFASCNIYLLGVEKVWCCP